MVDERESLAAALAGRYTVGRLLGEGAMGRVYLAEDLKHHRPTALKVLRPEVAGGTGKARFEREISAISGLRHPHILPLIDSGEVDGLLYFITPYIEGETLAERLRREERLPLEDVVAVTRDVAEGLSYAHRLGLLHRDIKPSNILLSEGHALIADFGLARAVTEPLDERLSSRGLVVGTPAYMSPEQVSGEVGMDGRADIYALGCVVFEMLAGRPPFSGRGLAAILAGHLTDPVPDLEELRPEVPGPMREAVERALAKEPEDRWEDAARFADALDEAVAGGGGVHTGAAWRRSSTRRRSRWLLMGGGSLALAVALFLGIAYGRSDSAGPGPDAGDEAPSFVVVAYRPPDADPDERAELRHTEEELSRQLTGWRGVSVVTPSARAAVEAGMDLGEDRALAADQALEIARRAGAATLVAVERTVRDDSAYVVGQRYDVGSREAIGPPVTAASLASDLAGLLAPVAARALDFDGPPEELATLKRESRSLRAVRLVRAGRADLAQRRLPAAERLLREAIATDSTFGRAHYLLSVTLYWKGSEEPALFADMGGEMRRHASTARRLAGSMPDRDRASVEAFFHFQNGEYQEAREDYEALVASDPTDVWAWLHLGAVEYRDPWAVEGPDGELRPRGSFNRATDAFLRAVREEPDFYLGFGHLFDVYGRISAASRGGVCYGYAAPGEGTILFWEVSRQRENVSACPVVRDTVEFVDRPTLRTIPRQELMDGAQRYLDQAIVELRRWAEYAPDSPWPSKALAGWVLARADLRVAAGATVPWAELVADGVEHAERALALSVDTMPEDLVTAANFRLATGDLSGAAAALDRAVALAGGSASALPREAANAYMAAGDVEDALRVGVRQTSRMTVPDADGNRIAVLVRPLIARIQILCATGVTGPRVTAVFDEIESTWIRAGYTERQRSQLRRFLAPSLLCALSLDPEARERWMRGWEPDDALLRGLVAASSDPAQARQRLAEAMEALEGRVPDRRLPFASGVLAQELADHRRAITAFSRIRNARAQLSEFDEGWGLGSLAYLFRARSYEALGDSTRALSDYRWFAEAWKAPDPAVAHLKDEAVAAIRRLEG